MTVAEESESEKPSWWVENERVRESLGLPPYDPPRFEDGVYVHEVMDDLSDAYGCSIDILGVGTDYLEDWEVRVDGETAFEIGRHRDDQGNTVYRLPAEEFREQVSRFLAKA